MLNKKEIQKIKERANNQFNWANITVLGLIENIEILEKTLKTLEYTEDTRRIGSALVKFCPVCKAAQGRQEHYSDCELNKLLKLYR